MEFILDNLTKSTGIYRCPDDIKHFKIRIKIKEGPPIQNANKGEDGYKEKEFSWQEKYFSKTQKEFYRDERNCYTDRERDYHRMISEQDEDSNDDFLFSYVNEEGFYPENEVMGNISHLENSLSSSNLKNSLMEQDEYDFYASLQRSIENPLHQDYEETMYLMADFGEYFENTWIKNEKILCTLKYNADSKVLRIFPDFTTTHLYVIKIEGHNERIFSYFIENSSNNIPESIDANEKTLIKKIHDYQASIKNQLVTDAFKLPPKHKLYVFLFLEISSGSNFENPEVYVQYFIQLPDGWSTSETEKLKGKTHLCRACNEEGLLHFGHCIDVLLEYNFMHLEHIEFPKSPYIYFEVISKDSWDRFRSEGLCYKNLPVSQSGMFNYNLNCFRFTSTSPVGEMKRFFIGDCQNYDDVTWIGIPNGHEGEVINKTNAETIGTGELKVRLNVMHQSQEFLDERAENVDRTRRIIFERLGSSTLIKSVEQVIQEFKKARKEMLEARKNI